jgi:Skp family chaperone for outer membrane proteins
MRDRIWRWSFVAALTMIGAALWHAQISPALAQGGANGSGCSTCVAVIDLDAVFEQLQEKGDRLQELDAFGVELQDELDQLEADLKQIQNEKAVLMPGTPEFEAVALRELDASALLQLKKEVAQVRFDDRRKRIEVAMFNKIVDAATRYAQREGIEVLLSDDQSTGLNDRMQAQQVQARLLTKKVVYTSPSKSVTDDVVTMMNNEYRAQP